ncbi:MAG: energy-coupling factor ABC transporter ATP-binding protein [Deltaproteobacteria bacterium]|nr:energy-coupling factor ABC transporter ATP-binding protein [Deltaproteobacteria bacterium]
MTVQKALRADLFRLEQVRQCYGGRTVLEVDSLTICRHAIIGLAGPNGGGKSTLLRVLAFIEDPATGIVIFEGRPCSTRHGDVRKKVTLLAQEPYLLDRSVHANVAYGLSVRGDTNVGEKVRGALDMVGLCPARFAKRACHELSGGEAQRVALAARLVLRPRVLLLDEPTASLDAESAQRIKAASMAARRDWGATLVIASHDMAWLKSVCDQILYMQGGRIHPDPPVAEFAKSAKLGNRWIQGFHTDFAVL